MHQHTLAFGWRQAPALAQCAPGEANLADIMQQTGQRYDLHLCIAQLQAAGQLAGVFGDALRVLAGAIVENPQSRHQRPGCTGVEFTDAVERRPHLGPRAPLQDGQGEVRAKDAEGLGLRRQIGAGRRSSFQPQQAEPNAPALQWHRHGKTRAVRLGQRLQYPRLRVSA